MTLTRYPATERKPQFDEMADVLFARYKAQASVLVHHIKDQAYDDAVLLLVGKLLDVHTQSQAELLRSLKSHFGEPEATA